PVPHRIGASGVHYAAECASSRALRKKTITSSTARRVGWSGASIRSTVNMECGAFPCAFMPAGLAALSGSSVLEAGGEDGRERAVAGPSRSVPASLHASLMARLDRLGSGKEVAQIGAVLGREFSYALLAAVARNDETKLQSALEGLTSAGLLFRQGAPPH